MSAVHYDSYSDARAHLKDLLDAAERGRVATVRRESASAAVLDAARLRHFLASVVPSRAQVVPEAGGWSVFIPGLPVAADGRRSTRRSRKWWWRFESTPMTGRTGCWTRRTTGITGAWCS